MRAPRRRGTIVTYAVAAAVGWSALLPTAPEAEARAGRSDLFDKLAGSWSGAGEAGLTGGAAERLRCRADFTPAGPALIRMQLRCASGSYAVQVQSDIARQGSRFAGSWTETSTGVSGNLSGDAGSDRLRGVVEGLGISAALLLTVHGDVQAVTLVSSGSVSASASVTLRRA